MPTVPTLERTVEIAPPPTLTAPRVGPATQTTSTAISLLEDERRKADQLAVLDTDNQIAQFQSSMVTEMTSRQGKNAFGIVQEAQGKWRELGDRTLKGLATDGQRQSVQGRLQSRWTQTQDTLQRHTASERMKFDDQSVQTFLANSIRDVKARDFDPAAVQSALEGQGAVITDAFDRRGAIGDKVVLEEVLAQNRSDTYQAVIEQMISNGQGTQIRNYMSALPVGVLTHDLQAKLLELSRAQEAATQGQAKQLFELVQTAVERDWAAQANQGILSPSAIEDALTGKHPYITPEKARAIQAVNDAPVTGAGSQSVGAIMTEYHLGPSTIARIEKTRQQLLRLQAEGVKGPILDRAAAELQTDQRMQEGVDATKLNRDIADFTTQYDLESGKPLMGGMMGTMGKNAQASQKAEGRRRIQNGEKPKDVLKELLDRNKAAKDAMTDTDQSFDELTK